jgi:hypothetical protein
MRIVVLTGSFKNTLKEKLIFLLVILQAVGILDKEGYLKVTVKVGYPFQKKNV